MSRPVIMVGRRPRRMFADLAAAYCVSPRTTSRWFRILESHAHSMCATPFTIAHAAVHDGGFGMTKAPALAEQVGTVTVSIKWTMCSADAWSPPPRQGRLTFYISYFTMLSGERLA